MSASEKEPEHQPQDIPGHDFDVFEDPTVPNLDLGSDSQVSTAGRAPNLVAYFSELERYRGDDYSCDRLTSVVTCDFLSAGIAAWLGEPGSAFLHEEAAKYAGELAERMRGWNMKLNLVPAAPAAQCPDRKPQRFDEVLDALQRVSAISSLPPHAVAGMFVETLAQTISTDPRYYPDTKTAAEVLDFLGRESLDSLRAAIESALLGRSGTIADDLSAPRKDLP
ncbi:hypothetical protein F3087_00695 [Nocardia colli]|uniref:Uncharacterized protein n=1 Tax=Nocardia colli TaxID=2545717 RepID=A0A5N0EQM0_9NOCA|nr:hypothetical protein [Nocardia colli]KAA8889881.1 hypothetical protein F3087_00695 [Nocardia colli]